MCSMTTFSKFVNSFSLTLSCHPVCTCLHTKWLYLHSKPSKISVNWTAICYILLSTPKKKLWTLSSHFHSLIHLYERLVPDEERRQLRKNPQCFVIIWDHVAFSSSHRLINSPSPGWCHFSFHNTPHSSASQRKSLLGGELMLDVWAYLQKITTDGSDVQKHHCPRCMVERGT